MLIEDMDVTRSLSPQWMLFLGMFVVCNALPVIGFLVYSILTAVIVFATAAFVQFVAMVAGCAVLVPAILFASTLATILSMGIIVLRAFLIKLDQFAAPRSLNGVPPSLLKTE